MRSKTLGNGTSGREIFIVETAAKANSIEMGFFYRRQAELIAKYNKKVAPVTRASSARAARRCSQTGRGTVSLLPVDYLLLVAAARGSCRGAGRGGEMWITGRASQRATAQLAALGWTLVPKAGGRLGE